MRRARVRSLAAAVICGNIYRIVAIVSCVHARTGASRRNRSSSFQPGRFRCSRLFRRRQQQLGIYYIFDARLAVFIGTIRQKTLANGWGGNECNFFANKID